MTEFGKALARDRDARSPAWSCSSCRCTATARGWFKENWQREKMTALGLPDFGPVQNNVSFNDAVGTTRGIHAEPWDKWVSVATGRIFGAWVDLREGPTFGAVFTTELDPSRAIFVPRGVGNSYQTLEPDTAYTYLVNDHWSPDADVLVPEPRRRDRRDRLADPARPTSRSRAKDLAHPRLADVTPIPPAKTLVLGATASSAARCARSSATPRTSSTPTAPSSTSPPPTWRPRAAGATTTRSSMPPPTPPSTWPRRPRAARTRGPRTSPASPRLARIATENGITLVHVSSDYVFDGTLDRPVQRRRPALPARRLRADQGRRRRRRRHGPAPLHRPHVLGHRRRQELRPHDGLARRARHRPEGRRRPDRTPHLHRRHRARHPPPARDAAAPTASTTSPDAASRRRGRTSPARCSTLTGHDPARVTGVTTDEYFATATGPVAPRPRNSVLDLAKLEATGFAPRRRSGLAGGYLARSRRGATRASGHAARTPAADGAVHVIATLASRSASCAAGREVGVTDGPETGKASRAGL